MTVTRTWALLATAAALAGLGLAARTLVAGPLDPSAGPITPTFKTLSEVEPRTAINSTNTPGSGNAVYKITAPGSYYLTGNINVPATMYGISVAGVDVTIDLNGYTISGVGYDGIYGSAAGGSLTVRNGTIRGLGTGIETSQTAIVEDVAFIGCYDGADLYGGHSVVRRCSVLDFGWIGIDVSADNALVEDCLIDAYGKSGNFNAGIYSQVGGLTVRGCTLINDAAGGTAINGGSATDMRIENCVATGWYHGLRPGARAAVRGCSISSASQYGVYLDNNVGGTFIESNRFQNCSYGVWASSSAADGKTTIIRNMFTKVTTPIGNAGTADAGPQQTAAASTSPTANIVNN